MDRDLILQKPRLDLVESYRALVREFEDAGEDLVPFPLSFSHQDGPALISRLDRAARGHGLPEGFVPHSTFWMIHQDSTVVGVSNLRHELTPHLRHEGGHLGYGIRPSMRGNGFGTEILRLTLAEAVSLGLERVLVACDADNTHSIRVILSNGGVIETDDVRAKDGTRMHRYWIDLEADAV